MRRGRLRTESLGFRNNLYYSHPLLFRVYVNKSVFEFPEPYPSSSFFFLTTITTKRSERKEDLFPSPPHTFPAERKIPEKIVNTSHSDGSSLFLPNSLVSLNVCSGHPIGLACCVVDGHTWRNFLLACSVIR